MQCSTLPSGSAVQAAHTWLVASSPGHQSTVTQGLKDALPLCLTSVCNGPHVKVVLSEGISRQLLSEESMP